MLVTTQYEICYMYKGILLDVSYGCETFSLILKEEDILRIFGNRKLGRIFGYTREEVKEGLRKL